MRTVVEPYRGGVAVTKSDDTVLAPTRGLYVGGAGDLTVDFADGTTNIVIKAPPVGSLLPISVVKVKAATTATLIVALY